LGIEDVKGVQSFNEGLPVEGTPPKPKILHKIQCGQECETASSRATSETLEFWNLGTLVLCNLEPCVWLQPKLRTLAPAPAGNLWNPVWGQERHKWRMLSVPKQMFSMLSKKTKLEK
jgi:hypothetical protein